MTTDPLLFTGRIFLFTYFRTMARSNVNLKKIGFISKLNGYKGELVLVTEADDFFDEDFLFMKMDGIPVPFAVEDIFEKGGNVVVKFEDVEDEAQAQRFMRQEVFMQQKKKIKNAVQLSAHALEGFHIIDETFGDLGPIIRVDEFPQQLIAICHYREKEVLVPLHDDFVLRIDEDQRQVHVDLPEGLIDIYVN